MQCSTCAFSPTSSTICPSLDAKSLVVTPGFILEIAPIFRDWTSSAWPSWDELGRVAYDIRGAIGISLTHGARRGSRSAARGRSRPWLRSAPVTPPARSSLPAGCCERWWSCTRKVRYGWTAPCSGWRKRWATVGARLRSGNATDISDSLLVRFLVRPPGGVDASGRSSPRHLQVAAARNAGQGASQGTRLHGAPRLGRGGSGGGSPLTGVSTVAPQAPPGCGIDQNGYPHGTITARSPA